MSSNNNNDSGSSRNSDPRKRAGDLHRKEEEGSPAKRHTTLQTDKTTRPAQQPQFDPTVLMHMMEFYKGQSEAWEKVARDNEKDNVKKDIEIQVLEAVNTTHLQNLQDAQETLHHLWRRNDILYATLAEIARANPELQERYMPWMTAETPPASPDEIDLTTDEEFDI